MHFFVACATAARVGALVLSTDGHAELKRVFVDPAARGKGVARAIMDALEQEPASLDVTPMQLETGIKQPKAIALYCKVGYAQRGAGVASFHMFDVEFQETSAIGPTVSVLRSCFANAPGRSLFFFAVGDRLGLAAVHPRGNHTPAPRISSTIRSLVLASGWS